MLDIVMCIDEYKENTDRNCYTKFSMDEVEKEKHSTGRDSWRDKTG